MSASERFRDLGSLAPTVVERQAAFRRMRPAGFRGVRQLVIVLSVAAVPAVIAVCCVTHFGLREALAVIAALLVGTCLVYFGHRYPMHRRFPGPLAIAYDMHTRAHHMLFDEDHTEIASLDDVDMVMLPPLHATGLCAIVVPVLAAPWLALGLDAALIFAAVSWSYYLAYELVHLASHGRVGGPLDRVPYLGWLLRHHRRHHALPLMHHGNFSMLIPLWDYLLGTKLPDRRP